MKRFIIVAAVLLSAGSWLTSAAHAQRGGGGPFPGRPGGFGGPPQQPGQPGPPMQPGQNGQNGNGQNGNGQDANGRDDPRPRWPDPRRDAERRAAEDAKRKEEQKQQKMQGLLDDGWSALRAEDPAAAVDAFTDLLTLKPDSGEARLGIGLARAYEGKWSVATAEFGKAMKDKSTERLAVYNAAVVETRLNQRPKAAVSLYNYLSKHAKPAEKPVDKAAWKAKEKSADKPAIDPTLDPTAAPAAKRPDRAERPAAESVEKPDEMVLNAEKTLLGTMDEAQRKGIGLLANIQATIAQVEQWAATGHPQMERYGIAWVPAGSASRLRAARVKEIYPQDLPFVLPDESVLPTKGKGAIQNSLLPAVATEIGGLWVAYVDQLEGKAAAGAGPARPTVVAAGAVGSGSTPAAPEVPTAAAPRGLSATGELAQARPSDADSATAATSTIRGAAFAVAPNLLVTCERLVSGATTVTVTDSGDNPLPAEVIATDRATGLALLKVAGTPFKPMALADATKQGSVGVACFAKPTVFRAELELLKADMIAPGGKFLLRMTAHPRSAGSPVVDDQGRVMAVVAANRDDPVNALPVVPADALRKFAAGKFVPSTASAGKPDQCVAELVVSRKRVAVETASTR